MTGEAKVLIGVGVVTLALFVGGILMLTKNNASPTPQTVDSAVLMREGSFRVGPAEAPITLVEFSDYQCPYCAQAQAVVDSLIAKYPDQLLFTYRHFPLSQHRHAVPAAEAAEAAGEQDKFWEMSNLIFERQDEWAEASDPLPIFQQYAEELELDLEQFNQAMSEHTYQAKILQGVADGNTLGVNSTPFFFLNGQKFTGGYNALPAAIEQALQ
ncbi:MAG: DSBA oxidoreductase [Candidatus Pacebacteria bacterium GW2011_GWB1_47_8]|nr:MAG: DSBA oxidoreductase [Candidatus Pacebacteria bacterium GW2011_GWA1_46_10]KKU84163.1 MAG: DSBA oxidoreductase [Candidatus Pacebacteria bacterium GW2011_GWB1_47_8]HCR81049.1 disulfide bond formation protein DsbA [Candidatus Paceibacterota bacterium]